MHVCHSAGGDLGFGQGASETESCRRNNFGASKRRVKGVAPPRSTTVYYCSDVNISCGCPRCDFKEINPSLYINLRALWDKSDETCCSGILQASFWKLQHIFGHVESTFEHFGTLKI